MRRSRTISSSRSRCLALSISRWMYLGALFFLACSRCSVRWARSRPMASTTSSYANTDGSSSSASCTRRSVCFSRALAAAKRATCSDTDSSASSSSSPKMPPRAGSAVAAGFFLRTLRPYLTPGLPIRFMRERDCGRYESDTRAARQPSKKAKAESSGSRGRALSMAQPRNRFMLFARRRRLVAAAAAASSLASCVYANAPRGSAAS